jgi:hypothetical protein
MLHILTKELFSVFQAPEENSSFNWFDIETEITVEDVLNYAGQNKSYEDDYRIDYIKSDDRRIEHIQRIRSIMQISPLLWKPISLDMDWTTSEPVLDDGHHRVFAASIMKLDTIPVEWSGYKEIIQMNFPKSFQLGLMF